MGITNGGLSPDKKLAVAVIHQKSESIDEADGAVLLVDHSTKEKIGSLGIFSTGGSWGTTTTNVHCQWSDDSKLLLVNFRTGRLMHSFQIYRIEGKKAVPIELPDIKNHPKAEILKDMEYRANPGSEVSFSKDGNIIKRCYGITPKNWGEFHEKYGMRDYDDVLWFIYEFDKDGRLRLKDATNQSPIEGEGS